MKTKTSRVTFLASTLQIGGAENMLLELVRHMDRDRFPVRVLCLRSGGRMSDELRELGVPVRDNIIAGRFDVSAAWKVTGLLKSENTDVLCMLNHDDAMFWGKVCSRASRTPVALIWVHSNLIPGQKPMVRIINHLTAGMITKIVSISKSHRQRILETYTNLSPSLVDVIYNGVDTDLFHPGDRNDRTRVIPDAGGFGSVVGTVARLSPEKNMEVLLEAARLVLEEKGDTLFVIAGDGPERPSYERKVESLGIGGNVRFLGMRRDVPQVMRSFDIAALSSREEVFPMFLLEAMATGLPVVSTAVGSIDEIVEDGETGFLVETGDHGTLAERLLALVNDPRRLREMGKRGMERVEEHFSIRTMVDSFQGLITELLDRHPRP